MNSHTSASIAVIEAAGVASIGAALAALTEATVHGGVVNYSIVGVVALATFLGKLLPSNITEQVAADIAVGLPVLKAAETPAAQQTQTTSSTTTTSAPTPTVFPAA